MIFKQLMLFFKINFNKLNYYIGRVKISIWLVIFIKNVMVINIRWRLCWLSLIRLLEGIRLCLGDLVEGSGMRMRRKNRFCLIWPLEKSIRFWMRKRLYGVVEHMGLLLGIQTYKYQIKLFITQTVAQTSQIATTTAITKILQEVLNYFVVQRMDTSE